MIELKELDYSLSLKIGDPTNDNGDGGIFDASDRVKYLERAYSRLSRILPKLMGKETPMFASVKSFVTQAITSDTEVRGDAIKVKENGKEVLVEEVEELYVKVVNIKGTSRDTNDTEKTVKAIHISCDKYISVKNGENDQYTPATDKVYYTFLDNSIYLLPRFETNTFKYSELQIVYKKDSPSFTMESLVPITNEYADILIVMAANEAMQDIARGDKVSLYTGDLSGQLAILKGYSDKIEAREGSSTDG